MSWLAGTTILCFATSYTISLLLEASRLVFQIPSRFLLLVGMTAAGWLAHSVFLFEQVTTEAATRGVVPLSSWHDFCLVAAWFIAGAYLGLSVRRPANTVGIFVLPLVLALVGAAIVVRDVGGFPPQRALSTWRVVHGIALSLGTAAVTLGFATGTMYLVQAYRLKHKLLPRQGLRLPSLEWLQRFNRESLVISTCLLAIGLLSGVVLNLGHRSGDSSTVRWTDPVVLSSSVLFAWLLAIVVFEACYRPARQGRKIAYLTLASFLFLLLVLGFVLAGEHATESPAQADRNRRAGLLSHRASDRPFRTCTPLSKTQSAPRIAENRRDRVRQITPVLRVSGHCFQPKGCSSSALLCVNSAISAFSEGHAFSRRCSCQVEDAVERAPFRCGLGRARFSRAAPSVPRPLRGRRCAPVKGVPFPFPTRESV
jgi:ABC-type transport system involved in cytochrome c biogenesis permease subunit